MKEKTEEKNKIQKNALDISRKNKNIILEWATGTGKTYASVKIIDDIIKNNKSAFGYLICKESTHLNNWLEDIKIHGMDHILSNLDSLLYASLHKKIKKADFIIFDECHAITPKRLEEIRRLIGENTKLIFLSATIPKEKKYLISKLCVANEKYYTISLLDAIKLNILPKPKVIVEKISLKNDNNRIYEFKMIKGKNKKTILNCNYLQRWNYTKSIQNYELTVKCNEFEYYSYLTSQMEYYDKLADDPLQNYIQRSIYRNKFLNMASQRKKFIAKVKTEKAKEIINRFKNEKSRFICFTGSIEQSLELGGKSSVNSKNKKDVNEELINGFNSKMYSELYAVNMLREGLNLNQIEKGLIIQLDSTVGSYFQMLGRMMRYKFPLIYLIVLKNTQDEKYFERAMVDFDMDFIEEINEKDSY